MACFPGLAQAEEATGPQYVPELPNVPKHEGSDPDGSREPGQEDGEAQASGGSPGGGSGGNGDSRGPGGGNTGQGSQAPGAGDGKESTGSGRADEAGGGKAGVGSAEPLAASSDDSSSPLVPILIAIAVLAAISVAAFYYRQRRQASGSPISPKAS
jgi:hypothetical protein